VTGLRLADGQPAEIPAAGSYWLHGTTWYAITPNGMLASLANHTVEVHDDGTISVSPSIRCRSPLREWHGFLERGTWRDA
jgi:hypothetical protein